MDFNIVFWIVMAVLVGLIVWQAFWGRKENRPKARQELLMAVLAGAAAAVWYFATKPLAALFHANESLILFLLILVVGGAESFLYQKLNVKVSGMTLEEQYRAQLEKYARRRDYNAAIQSGEKLVKEAPNAANYYLLAKSCELNKNLKEAVRYYLKATELDPALYLSWNNMGTCYMAMKETAKAVEALSKAWELNRQEKKQDPSVPANLAYALASMNKPTEAEECLQQAKALGYKDKNDLIERKIRGNKF